MLKTVLQKIGRRLRTPPEPTIKDMLSDSIVQAVMEADRIDPCVLREELMSIARQISVRRTRNGLREGSPDACDRRRQFEIGSVIFHDRGDYRTVLVGQGTLADSFAIEPSIPRRNARTKSPLKRPPKKSSKPGPAFGLNRISTQLD